MNTDVKQQIDKLAAEIAAAVHGAKVVDEMGIKVRLGGVSVSLKEEWTGARFFQRPSGKVIASLGSIYDAASWKTIFRSRRWVEKSPGAGLDIKKIAAAIVEANALRLESEARAAAKECSRDTWRALLKKHLGNDERGESWSVTDSGIDLSLRITDESTLVRIIEALRGMK